jgi:hypothetical protein
MYVNYIDPGEKGMTKGYKNVYYISSQCIIIVIINIMIIIIVLYPSLKLLLELLLFLGYPYP